MTAAGESKRWVKFEWLEVIRLVPLPPVTRLVARTLADYCDAQTGENAHPGVQRLARECSISKTYTREHLAILCTLGLLEETAHGWGNQYDNEANVYALRISEPVAASVERLREAVKDPRYGNPSWATTPKWYRNPSCFTSPRWVNPSCATREVWVALLEQLGAGGRATEPGEVEQPQLRLSVDQLISQSSPPSPSSLGTRACATATDDGLDESQQTDKSKSRTKSAATRALARLEVIRCPHGQVSACIECELDNPEGTAP